MTSPGWWNLVDTRDLKSRGPKGPCRFESGSGHHNQRLAARSLRSFNSVLPSLCAHFVPKPYFCCPALIGDYVEDIFSRILGMRPCFYGLPFQFTQENSG